MIVEKIQVEKIKFSQILAYNVDNPKYHVAWIGIFSNNIQPIYFLLPYSI